MFKTCNKCKIEKSFDSFHKDRHKKDGLYGFCKNCTTAKVNNYRLSNLEIIKQKKELHRRTNKEQYNAIRRRKYLKNKDRERAQQKVYFQNNKEIWNKYSREQYKTNPTFKLKLVLRNRINKVLSGAFKAGSPVKDLDCTPEQLKIYLESKFKQRHDMGKPYPKRLAPRSHYSTRIV